MEIWKLNTFNCCFKTLIIEMCNWCSKALVHSFLAATYSSRLFASYWFKSFPYTTVHVKFCQTLFTLLLKECVCTLVLLELVSQILLWICSMFWGCTFCLCWLNCMLERWIIEICNWRSKTLDSLPIHIRSREWFVHPIHC